MASWTGEVHRRAAVELCVQHHLLAIFILIPIDYTQQYQTPQNLSARQIQYQINP